MRKLELHEVFYLRNIDLGYGKENVPVLDTKPLVGDIWGDEIIGKIVEINPEVSKEYPEYQFAEARLKGTSTVFYTSFHLAYKK